MPSYLIPGHGSRPDPRLAEYQNIRSDNDLAAAPLEDVIAGKRDTLATILQEIGRETRERRRLSDAFARKVQDRSCVVGSKLLAFEDYQARSEPITDARRSALERQLEELEKEERQERIAMWRDVSRLKTEFRRWFLEFCNQKRRTIFLTKKPARLTDKEALNLIEDDQGKPCGERQA